VIGGSTALIVSFQLYPPTMKSNGGISLWMNSRMLTSCSFLNVLVHSFDFFQVHLLVTKQRFNQRTQQRNEDGSWTRLCVENHWKNGA